MSELDCQIPDLLVTKPKGLSSRLFFQVYNGPNAIAFAQLSSRSRNSHRRADKIDGGKGDFPSVSYCLRNIEVSQQYRNKGIGSALLKEVICFLKQESVSALYGEAKGDLDALKKWYSMEGFELDSVNHIQLSLAGDLR